MTGNMLTGLGRARSEGAMNAFQGQSESNDVGSLQQFSVSILHNLDNKNLPFVQQRYGEWSAKWQFCCV
jgi:hypothetical protein